jgi:6,7-dimethyl-8-ribityllumazine synthase
MAIIEGKMVVEKGTRFGIIVSRFNEFITGKLLEGALDALKRHGADEKNIDVVWVPGSFEIPQAALLVARTKKYDGVICIGAVIRGATPHFEYLSAEVTKGVAQVAMESSIPVVYGVITPDTLEQAIERAGTKAGNKGQDAAEACIELVNLFKQLR